MSEESKKIGRLFLNLQQSRQQYEPVWKQIIQYLIPDHGQFITEGEQPDIAKNYNYIFDSVPYMAAQLLAGGFQGMIPRNQPWLRIGVTDPEKNKYFKSYFDEVSDILLSLLEFSNFYSVLNYAMMELIGFGTASVIVQEHPDKKVWFRPLTAGEYYLGVDIYQNPNTIARSFYTTAENIVTQFEKTAEEIPSKIRDAAKKYNQEPIEVSHLIMPNTGRDTSKIDNGNKKFVSFYFLANSACKVSAKNNYPNADVTILSKSGYDEFACPTIRWKISGSDIYGRSPAMGALADIKLLYRETRAKLDIIDHQAHPASNVSPDIKQQMNDDVIAPGAVFDMGSQGEQKVSPVLPPGYFDISGVLNDIPSLQNKIQKVFYNDLLLMIADKPNVQQTAFEIARLVEQKGAVLGHLLHRLEVSFYDPIIDRVFEIANRAGLIPQPPPELSKEPIKPEYKSLLFRIAEEFKKISMDKSLGMLGQVAQFDPNIIHKLNADVTMDETINVVNAPADMFYSSEEYTAKLEAIKQQQAVQMEAQQTQEQIGGVVGAAKELSQTDTEGKNALTDMLNAGEK